MAGKSYIKVGAYDWDRIKKMYVKTGGQTWTAIRKAYVKTSSGWRKVFDTASNRPFIQNNDIPKIRLNTFRTNSTYNPTGTIDDPVNPVVEAPPVQQMGPNYTSPVLGWPYESLGRHLWGYDGDWVSGNGSAMTFVYTWLYNLSGNQNDNEPELNATSSTGRTDMLTNLSSYLGQNDGDYFDRNFLTFRVSATNSAGTASSESAQVYIVRERPTGTITMLDKDIAFTTTTMSASFTYSSRWYDKTDIAESYVEWFAVDNLTDTLTTSNRVQIEYLNTFSATGTTTKSAATFHNPTLINKYYVVRLTLNNSNTLPAKYLGSVINVSGFIPNSAFTVQDNKNIKTNQAQDPEPFNTISFIKGFPSSSSQGVVRSTSLSWNASTNATRYQILYEGSNDNVSWTTEQSFAGSPYYTTTSHSASWGSPKPIGGYNYYTFMRASIRASNPNSSIFAFSDGGSSGSPVYIYAAGTAPTAPSFGTITAGFDTATIPVSISSSTGSNFLYSTLEYMVRKSTQSYPSTWSTTTISGSSASISLTGLDSSSTYFIKVRVRNFDDLYAENETSFNTGAALTGATSTFISSMSRLNDTTVRAVIGSFGASGPYYQMYWQSGSTAPSTPNYDAASTSSTVTEDFSFSNGITYYFYIRSSNQNLGNTVEGGTATTGTFSSYGPSTGAASYTFASPTGTVSVSPSSGTAGVTTYTASPSVSAAPSADISYQWQYFEGGSFGWVALSGATSSTYSPPSNYASIYGTGLRCQIVANNGVGTLTTQSSSVTVNAALSKLSTPTAVNASDTLTDGVLVSWNPVTGAAYYGVWYGSAPSYDSLADFGGNRNTSLITGNSYFDTAIGSGVTRDYYVQAYRSGDPTGTKSEWGGPNSGTRAVATPNATAPTSVSATGGNGSATVNWSGATNAVKYRIWWAGNPTGNAVDPASSFDAETTSTSFTFTGFSNGTTYYFWVSASNTNNVWTPYSSSPRGQATPSAPVVSAPSTPTGVNTSGSGLVTWNASSGATSYTVEYYTATNSSGANQTGPYYGFPGSSTSFQISYPTVGGVLQNWARARVSASNSGGTSSYSGFSPASGFA